MGRPTPCFMRLHFQKRVKRKVILREDLNHTGAHKINNTLGQILLAKHMGKIVLLQKQVPVSMALQQRQYAH